MTGFNTEPCENWSHRPDDFAMRAANVNPQTGLATDFLNLFNEYVMLGEMVADGSMPAQVLDDWKPVDYESHFSQSGFAGSDVVLAAFRSLESTQRRAFEDTVNLLIELILDHQISDAPTVWQIEEIKKQRDRLSEQISGPASVAKSEGEDTQAAIDALFE